MKTYDDFIKEILSLKKSYNIIKFNSEFDFENTQQRTSHDCLSYKDLYFSYLKLYNDCDDIICGFIIDDKIYIIIDTNDNNIKFIEKGKKYPNSYELVIAGGRVVYDDNFYDIYLLRDMTEILSKKRSRVIHQEQTYGDFIKQYKRFKYDNIKNIKSSSIIQLFDNCDYVICGFVINHKDYFMIVDQEDNNIKFITKGKRYPKSFVFKQIKDQQVCYQNKYITSRDVSKQRMEMKNDKK